MKKTFAFAAFLSAALPVLADATHPEVSAVTLTPDAETGLLTVSYHVDAPAVVTVDFVDASGVSIGLENCTSLAGAANAYLSAAGDYSFTWDVRTDLANGKPVPSSLRAKLTAWSPDEPPPYMVADLLVSNTIRYYASTNAFPGGFGSDAYKTTKLVLRKIPAAGVTWQFGSTTMTDDRCYAQKVRLTKNFYIGVYAVTHAQLCAICGSESPCYDSVWNASTVTNWWKLPVDYVRHSSIRGSAITTNHWPATDAEVSGSYIARLRERTGLHTFDLPTDAQWEYAARAGMGTSYPWGDDAADMDAYAWTSHNWQQDPDVVSDCNSNRTHEVGLLKPNAWGLYDMIGNLCEWAQDLAIKDFRLMTQYRDPNDSTVFVDPYGASADQAVQCWGSGAATNSGGKRCLRNKDYSALQSVRYLYVQWRTAEWGNPTTNPYKGSFRVACPAKCN